MSDFNNFNNQTPPNNNRPDYSYNWNGSEHKNNNNKKGGRAFLIVLLAAALIFTIVISAVVSAELSSFLNGGTDDSSESSSQSDSGSSADGSFEDVTGSNNGNGGNSGISYPIPDFTPSDDADADLSTTLTEIYENCAPACCTVSVSYQGQPYSIGSGFVIDAENGYIATNHHVIETGTSITVIFYDGREYEAELINSDSVTDLAVLKIEAEGLVQVEFGDSDNVKVGQNVVAIGTPYDQGLAGTMTCGIVSGVARDIDITNDSGKIVKTMTLLQTDCSINPGNSGGPLIDMAGNVIGVTSLKLVDEQYEGIGFAIPITGAIDIFKKLISGEDIGDTVLATASAKIGITAYELDYAFEYYRLNPRCDYPEGVLVGEIEYDSAAYQAGLNACDIITDFNGETITSLDDLTSALEKYKAGDEVTVTVFRFNRNLTSGDSYTVTFKLDAAN